MSVSKEDFLKTIYHISYDDDISATPSELARRLNISNAAITDMAKKLSAEGLIAYEKYRPVSLTAQGLQIAISVLRKHRLWETFLHLVLDIPVEDLHREAEMLEHSTSERLIRKIEEFLDYPEFDPHGDPIPDDEGLIPSTDDMMTLNHCQPGVYKISRLQHRNRGFSEFFAANKISVNKIIEIVDQFPDIESSIIRINNEKIVINAPITSQIYLKNLK